MEFESLIAQAWADHVRDPQGVADRLPAVRPLVVDEQQFIGLADITHHVWGDHLNDRPAGLAAIAELMRLPVHRADGPSGVAVRRFIASLRLSDGDDRVLDAFDLSDRIRVVALAISNLTDADPPRAVRLLHHAIGLAESSGLPSSDPMHGELAHNAHNMAAGIERMASPSSDDVAAMLLAAQTARHHWGLSGEPSDVFAGEWRWVSACRKAGDEARARAGAAAALAAFDRLDAAGQARHAAKRAQLAEI